MWKVLLLGLVGLVVADYYDLDDDTRRGMLGTRLDVRGAMTQGVKVEEATELEHLSILATMNRTFDAARAWPQCANTINFIKDQAACGSCWAVAASSALADRFCISCGYGSGANNNMNTNNLAGQVPNERLPGFVLSAEDLMSCCRYCGDGCNGGYPIDAMRYAYIKGYVSGGWYGSKCGCQAYKIAPIRQPLQPTPACSSSCDDNHYPESDSADRHKVKSYKYVRGEAAMMKEIAANGPIECAFEVYASFENFFRDPANAKKVYTGPRDELRGGHAIKIVGWGEQMQDGQNLKYWQIHNSWNVTWADNGQFKYLRGHDLFGMEHQCVSAAPTCQNNAKKFASLQCLGRDFTD